MMIFSCHTTFLRLCRRAWAASCCISAVFHLVLFAALLGLATALTATAPTALTAAIKDGAEAVHYLWLMEQPTPKDGSPMDGSSARAWLHLARRDRQGEDTGQLLADLESLLAAAGGISDGSLAEIGAFLGHKPGTYIPRAYYLDEVNPNADLRLAVVVRATAFAAEDGQSGYTIALQDKERDEFVFSLKGEPAKALASQGLVFGDKRLADGESPFDLRAARIADIRRWLDKRGQAKGYIIIMQDRRARVRTIHLPLGEKAPWPALCLLFARRPDGAYLHDPEDETTPLPQFFDHETGALYRVSEAPPRASGAKRARVEMLDAKGERLIFFVEGEQAEEMLARAGFLEKNTTLRRIFEKTGAADLLLQMQKEDEAAAGQLPQPGE